VKDPRAALREAGLRPKRSFGQNFLVAPHAVERIAQVCIPDDECGKASVIEVGAGTGILTDALARRARQVVAIERDRDLIPLLRAAFAEAPHVRVLEADAQAELRRAVMDLAQPEAAPSSKPVIAGNLPYQLTGVLVAESVGLRDEVTRCVFMVQREVADRLIAVPRTKAYGALSVFVQAAFAPRIVLHVGAGSFHPPPDVESAVVLLVPHPVPRAKETEGFRALVRGAFGARRKTLRNAWKQLFATADELESAARAAGVRLEDRGETLDVEAFAAMARELTSPSAERP
jgi:16S rRNA (adenine1518-N6/adenine1519-N6)-dimethyltransferase